ncbi:LysE family translocator [Achromobacter anxifer]|jgi:homoserine/homoserine lactone efflux protein|uniref:Homoserine/homoserine lactone efflux protein n=1 Tax=Achromobacter anxifer TaxID=1287737 RepID=A0A6S7CQV0_9BURK|nr:LysE family translocator [Achromobacter anxifer]MDF8360658.1 LysE family translocator [Achromobacter anxifer]CAB3858566.1 Homoserine/homoserine lactone efflux protein [Achromobacter anxifer]
MTLATLLLFVLASAVTIVTPGPTVLLAMSNGSRHGVRAACWGMGGAVLADLILIGAVASGLGVVLAASEIAFQLIKWVGAAYLAYLGWKMLRSDAALVMPSAQPDAPRPAGLALGLRSFAVALTNPKALLFMSAFLPQFINPAAPLFAQYAVLAGVMALMNIAVMLAYAALGAQMVRAFQGAGLRWLNRVCGGLLIGLAATLALYRRSAP